MIKEEYLASIGIALLSVAFTTISLLLYFNKNSRWLVNRKIKLGAIMLTLTAIISSCTSNDDDFITCYSVTIDDTSEYTVSEDTNKAEINVDTLKTETIEEISVGLDSVGKINMPDNAMCYGAPASWDNSIKH